MINELKEINEGLKHWLIDNENTIKNLSFENHQNFLTILEEFSLVSKYIGSKILVFDDIKSEYEKVIQNNDYLNEINDFEKINAKVLFKLKLLTKKIDLYIDMLQNNEKETNFGILEKNDFNYVLVKNKDVMYWLNDGKEEGMNFIAKKTSFEKNDLFVIIGYGDGSFLESIPTHNPVIILDPFIDVEPKNIHKKGTEIIFICRQDINSIKFSTLLNQFNGLNINFQINPYYENEVLINEVKQVAEEIMLGLYEREIFNNTTRYFMIDWNMESILNSLYLEKNNQRVKDIRHFYGKFGNENALIVSAGPSLSESLSDIKRLQHTHFVIAIGQTYDLLKKQGIIPDIWLSIDAGIANFNMHLKEAETTQPLIHANLLNHNIVKNHKGLYFPITDAKEGLIKKIFEDSPIEHGFPSVANYAFYFAKKLGFSEIYLIGQDLAVRNGEYYTKEIFEKTKNTGSLNDEKLLIELNSGDIGETSSSLKIFHNTFEAIVKFFPDQCRVYNTSYFGAKIKGVPFKSLTDVNPIYDSLKKEINWEDAPNLNMPKSKKIINEFIESLNKLKIDVKKWLAYNEEILKKKKINRRELVYTLNYFNKIQSNDAYRSVVRISIEKELIAFNNVFEYQFIDLNDLNVRIKAFESINQLINVILEYIEKFTEDERYKEIKQQIG